MIRILPAALAAAVLLVCPVAAQDRAVAVTFDDLPYQAPEAQLCDPETAKALTRSLIEVLEPLDTRAAVFFNEGKVCDDRRAGLLPELLNLWLDAGFEIGNHTFSHINIHRNTVEAYLADVDRGAEITRPVLEARGQRLHWFRHPYLFTGETPEKHDSIVEGLARRGYDVAPVTIDNVDWMFADVYRKAEQLGDPALKARIGDAYVAHMTTVLDFFEPYSAETAGGPEPAQVLLLHANTLNRDYYPRIHALYLARGYRFVSLGEALTDPVYAHADTWVRANGVSWLHRWTWSDGRPVRWEPEPPEWIVAANRGTAADLAAARTGSGSLP